MLSFVASVEFQLKVEGSPLLTEAGLACNVTVGLAAAGGGAACWGGAATFFLPQPNVKTAAARVRSKPARYSGRGPGNTSYHDILYLAHKEKSSPRISAATNWAIRCARR